MIFFNALIWQRYPQLKIAINEMHANDMRQQPDNRTPQRDALTIFDENGIVIVSSQNSLLQDIIDFNWRKLFQYERQTWQQHCQCFVIGHALYEKFLTPYIGLTAHALLVKTDDAFFEQSFAKQRAQLNHCIAKAILDGDLYSPQTLNPVPVLGVPEWWSEQTDAFYANSAYFRAKSRERQVKMISLNPHEPF